VYKAFDRERNTFAALKLLKNLATHSVFRFKNEFRAFADLEHPNLVRLGELFCEDGRWFFTMELIDGIPFLAYVRPGDPIAPLDRDSGSFSDDTLPRST